MTIYFRDTFKESLGIFGEQTIEVEIKLEYTGTVWKVFYVEFYRRNNKRNELLTPIEKELITKELVMKYTDIFLAKTREIVNYEIKI